MSRSKKDGARRGGHGRAAKWWKEWGSRRGPPGWKDPGPYTKHITHRMERRSARETVGRFLRTVRDGFRLTAHALPLCEGCELRTATRWTTDEVHLCAECHAAVPVTSPESAR